jgi:pyruvate formate lyase activating enzyme
MLNIFGLKKTTLIDFPGRIACTAFTHGCTLRCPFCHNPELVVRQPAKGNSMDSDELLAFLAKRKGKLEGVVFSGGEPLLHLKQLRPLLKQIKALGYFVKIDTNGTLTYSLQAVLKEKLADYIAMDFKASPSRYSIMNANPSKTRAVIESLRMLKNSDIEYEIRTTLVPGIHDLQHLTEMMPHVADAKKYVLQNFQQSETVDPTFSKLKPFSREKMREFLSIARKFNPRSTVRLPD